MLSSATKSNRYQEMTVDIDCRFNVWVQPEFIKTLFPNPDKPEKLFYIFPLCAIQKEKGDFYYADYR